MTERIRELLDEAVAGVEPSSVDPIGAIIRRGRAARRRTVSTFVLVLAVAAAGAVTFGGRFSSGPVDVASADPSTPRVVGNSVVAGAIELPIPKGWTVLENDARRPCGELTRTILLITNGNRGCQYAPIELRGSPWSTPEPPLHVTGKLSGPDEVVEPPASITLSGGEPGWMTDALSSSAMRPGRHPAYYDELVLPWSRVNVTFRMDGVESQKIVDSMRSRPVSDGLLAVPTAAGSAEFTTPDDAGDFTVKSHSRTTSRGTIDAVLRLLRAQTTGIADDEACAVQTYTGSRLAFTSADGKDTTTVVFMHAKDCKEAVSSDGGRVVLGDDALAQLKTLFGIEAR